MNYELAKRLKDAGFSHNWCSEDDCSCLTSGKNSVCFPSLSKLIEAVATGEKGFEYLIFLVKEQKWVAYAFGNLKGDGSTPEEAVANLWLVLNKHGNEFTEKPSA